MAIKTLKTITSSTNSSDVYKVTVDWNDSAQVENKPEFKTINGESILGSGDVEIKTTVDWNDSTQIKNKPEFKTINGESILSEGNISAADPANIDPLAYREPGSLTIGKVLWNSVDDECITGSYYQSGGGLGGGTIETTFIPAQAVELDEAITSIRFQGMIPRNTAACFFEDRDESGKGIKFVSTAYYAASNSPLDTTFEVPEGANYFGFTSSTTYGVTRISIAAADTPKTLTERVNEINTIVEESQLMSNDKRFFQSLFQKVICIGDSQTAGWRRGGGDQKQVSYPAFLHQFYGWETDNIASGGQTASGWWGANGESTDWTKYDAAIIWLGQNQGLTDTLDEDVKQYDIDNVAGTGYTNYASTQTGCYCKIIGKALSINPSIQFFLIRAAASSNSGKWEVVQKIADYFDCAALDIYSNKKYVDICEDKYHPAPSSAGGTARDVIHYGTLGYWALAKQIYWMIMDVLMANENKYILWDEKVLIDCMASTGSAYTVTINGADTTVSTSNVTENVQWGSVVKITAADGGTITYNGTSVGNTLSIRIKDVLTITGSGEALVVNEFNKNL